MADDPERRELADLVECRAFRARLVPMAQALREWLRQNPPHLLHQELDDFFSAILDEPAVADADTAQPSPSQDDRERAQETLQPFDGQRLCSDDISQDSAWNCLLDEIAEIIAAARTAAHAAGHEAAVQALRDDVERWGIVPGKYAEAADYLAAHAPAKEDKS